MSFAFKIDKALKANLYKICRLCGIDREEKVNILDTAAPDNQPVDCDGELKLHQKISQCTGIRVFKDDKMPQSICGLCVDKINDFYEFREMCYATDKQTRSLLGLKAEKAKSSSGDVKPIIPIKEETATPTGAKRGRKRKAEEAIPKDDIPEVKRENVPPNLSTKKQRLNELASNPDTKKKGKLGKLLDKAVKPKEEIKEEPADTQIPSTAPTEKTTASKLKQACNICSLRFVSKLKLDRHVADTHVPNIPRYVCTACNETIKKNNDIKSHQLWHKLTKTPYMCGHCGQSLISSYAYSRHLRDHTVVIPPNLWVLDRECPQCHGTFLTNFLYNTHFCAVNTKKCAGCNRHMRNEAEYQRHAAYCSKVFLNYSKHISAAAAAAESSICIKNENDVEAAAAEALACSAGLPLELAPVVSLTRISTPEIMAARQGIIDYPTENTTAPVGEAKTPGKKGSKKGVSRKDLKRVDNLLKSTLDALVSIKHEPEVQVETEAETPAATEGNAHKVNEPPAAEDGDGFHGADDFHHGDNDDDDENSTTADAVHDTYTNNIAIKKEPGVETSAHGGIQIKQEIINLDSDDDASAAKMPVLKLKIKKEHGMLNSSIVEDQNVRSEKKKKKKKRKETPRNKDKSSEGDEPEEDTPPNSDIVVAIKQEKLDASDIGVESDRRASSESMQLEATVMTTIPIPQFQISAISCGVEFGDNITTAGHLETETEIEDIKPNKEELDRLFKITNVSSGVQLEAEMPAESSDEMPIEQDQDSYFADASEAAKRKTSRNITKVVKPKAGAEQKSRLLPQPRAKAFKSTAGVSKTYKTSTAASSSSISETASVDFSQIQIKPEPADRGYEDVFSAYEAAANQSTAHTLHPNEESSLRDIAEQEYLNSIDFANIQIKQEKDLDLSDVEITNTHITANVIPNGMQRSNGEESQYTDNEEDVDSEESDDEDGDDDDDEDTEVWDGVKEEGETREYRELEIPLLLPIDDMEESLNEKANDVTSEVGNVDNVIAESTAHHANVEALSTVISKQGNMDNVIAESTAHHANVEIHSTVATDNPSSEDALVQPNQPLTNTELTGDFMKSNESEVAPPPFVITNICSQADTAISNPITDIMDTDIPMLDTEYPDGGIDAALAPSTLKIASVVAGCSATFEDLLSQTQPEQLSTTFGMETMSIQPPTESMCLEVNQDKDTLLEAHPFFDNDGTGPANATNIEQMAIHSTENEAGMGITIQNVVAGAIEGMAQDVVEEAQNLLNHEVMEAQATQELATTSHSVVLPASAAQDVEEAENLMNEGVAEALLQQQQQQRLNNSEIQLPNNSGGSTDDTLFGFSTSQADIISKGSDGASLNENIGRSSQSAMVSRPFMLDDSNINEIAENNNNANIERELQDDVIANAAGVAIETRALDNTHAASSTANEGEAPSNVEVMESQNRDIT